MKRIEVVAAIIKKDNKILSTERGYGDLEGYWEFPGGKIEPGENKEQALKREIMEEMNVEIKVGDFITPRYKIEEIDLAKNYLLCKDTKNRGYWKHYYIENIDARAKIINVFCTNKTVL